MSFARLISLLGIYIIVHNYEESQDVHKITDNVNHSNGMDGENNFGGFIFRGGLRHNDIH